MNPMYDLLPEPMLSALGWTIVHSLWQGAVFAILLILVFKACPGLSSNKRYLIACWSLIGLMLVVLSTFICFYQTESREVLLSSPDTAIGSNAGFDMEKETGFNIFLGETIGGIFQAWSQFLQDYLHIIVFGWLVGILFMSLKTISEFGFIHFLKKSGKSPVPQLWIEKLEMLKKRIHLEKRIPLIISGKIVTPVVVGIIKPAILLPVSLVNGIPPSQLEALLLHELAHIKRYDPIVNFFQILIEVLLFFNPAVWWISNQIRIERENACDDFAIRTTGDAFSFAKTLAFLEENRLMNARTALAFSGKEGTVLARIKRIIHQKNSEIMLSRGFWSSTLLTFVFSTFIWGINTSTPSVDKPNTETISQAVIPVKINEMQDNLPILDDKIAIKKKENTIEKKVKEKKIETLKATLEKDTIPKKKHPVQKKKEKERLERELEKEMQELEFSMQQLEEEAREIEKSMQLEMKQLEEKMKVREFETQKLEEEARKVELEARKVEEFELQKIKEIEKKIIREMKLEMEKLEKLDQPDSLKMVRMQKMQMEMAEQLREQAHQLADHQRAIEHEQMREIREHHREIAESMRAEALEMRKQVLDNRHHHMRQLRDAQRDVLNKMRDIERKRRALDRKESVQEE
ncbi:MAG: hypothetical protein GY705_31170 [Bacteroidetes bacterium]|nr:hypothetical protein [Bacteroidota bacterium]